MSEPIENNVLIYDAECFFCSNYVRLLNIRASIGNITLINARDTEVVKKYAIEPALLNESMLLILKNNRYYGADAIHHLALVSTQNTAFNKINSFIFKRRTLAVWLYPLLKTGRVMYLFLAGKEQIH